MSGKTWRWVYPWVSVPTPFTWPGRGKVVQPRKERGEDQLKAAECWYSRDAEAPAHYRALTGQLGAAPGSEDHHALSFALGPPQSPGWLVKTCGGQWQRLCFTSLDTHCGFSPNVNNALESWSLGHCKSVWYFPLLYFCFNCKWLTAAILFLSTALTWYRVPWTSISSLLPAHYRKRSLYCMFYGSSALAELCMLLLRRLLKGAVWNP